MKKLKSAETMPAYLALASQGGKLRYHADWTDARHHYRRFASEFIGTFGFVFTLAGGAAIFHAYTHPDMSSGMSLALLTSVCSLWLVVAIHALGDVSAHFNPAVTFAFALRGDMSWKRAGSYVIVQCAAGAAAALLARAFFGTEWSVNLSSSAWQAVAGCCVRNPAERDVWHTRSGNGGWSKTKRPEYSTCHSRLRSFVRNVGGPL